MSPDVLTFSRLSIKNNESWYFLLSKSSADIQNEQFTGTLTDFKNNTLQLFKDVFKSIFFGNCCARNDIEYIR